ncbi:Molybdenum cofactor biosynthesis protein C [Oligella ureolytica]|uniref:Cyclic pyranopterin monophosphate synthase n=1 Tax=Oligella ureolytica TaxID=90244 RepID=A0A378X9M8_9BURK|nr:cyclic pyranopterin monophosphate synthase MoaC [Oligella ureolytica]NLP32396.1 cyclic pyranopterin monophosphate synthase MoaC [Oligella ureolytica]QPT40162.1 cyclic pyranopterin monophosphate synthase MoaC [Oligella ureolytica]SUA50304.1 Molybdenum cofactor biosynthesis protein C [Oligella ureolytica]SUA51463.1 Molybdenum cofactor biosynthesis protein C [Oligella ureolytica]
MSEQKLSHFNEQGQAHMVDVANKDTTKRQAVAEGSILMNEIAYNLLASGQSKKGDVFGVARIAAIQAAKQTSNLIPLCHPLALTHINVDFELFPEEKRAFIEVTVETLGKTGVEMEALTAASVGLLTIYDMLKAVDKGMIIQTVQLVKKSGGKSGDFERS